MKNLALKGWFIFYLLWAAVGGQVETEFTADLKSWMFAPPKFLLIQV